MARVLKHNVHIRKDMPIGDLIFLRAGTELPDWAEGRVGDHLFQDDSKEERVQARPSKPLPSVPKQQEPKPNKVEVPHREAHHTKWRSFLEADGTAVPTGTTRDEMIEMALEKFPDLEIPEDEE